MFGDSADEELLAKVGLATASAVVISFSDPGTSIGILRSVRRLRPDVPVLVRTADDARIQELREAGATEVVPETFEASLMLVSHVLMLLHVPVTRVVRAIGDIRSSRYAVLRNIVRARRRAPDGRDQRAPRGAQVGGRAAGRLGGGTLAGRGAQPRRRGDLHRRAAPGHSRPRAGAPTRCCATATSW